MALEIAYTMYIANILAKSICISQTPCALGKFDMEPDNYLMQLIRNPQQIDIGRGIEPFPEDVLRESFSLQQGRIPEVR
jgi:hypothetical protein